MLPTKVRYKIGPDRVTPSRGRMFHIQFDMNVCFSSKRKANLFKHVGNLLGLREKVTLRIIYNFNPQELAKST